MATMTSFFFGRPLASLALAVALAAPLSLAGATHAQLGRATPPTPVSATQFESMLKSAGLPDTVKDAALPLHETYFERFRDFEEREVKPAIEGARASAMSFTTSVDDAKQDAEASRRLLQRAAQLDSQLVDELIGVLTSEDAVRAEALRDALTRRRCCALTPRLGFVGSSLEFELRVTPALAAVDADVRQLIDPTLDAYDSELTRLLERHAEATIARGVRAAEIRAELGLGNGPEISGDGEDGAQQAAAEDWFAKARDVQKRASEEVTLIAGKMRRLHRDTTAQLEPLLPAASARELRSDMTRALYPSLHIKSEFAALVRSAETKRSKGEIDDTLWSSVQSLVDGHDATVRPLVDSAMTAADKLAGDQLEGMMIFGAGGEENPDQARVSELHEQIAAADSRDSDALRALLGLEGPAPQTATAFHRGGINGETLGTIELGGAELGEAIGGAISAVMVGADGEMMVFSGDDLGDGAMPFFGVGGGSPRLARTMTREELDALAQKLGFGEDTRIVFDEIVAKCAASRTAAESEFGTLPQMFSTSEGGEMSYSITLDGPSGAIAPKPDGPVKLAAAVNAAEELMFDELKAAAGSEKSDAAEVARRSRARTRMLAGEKGAQVADLVAIADAAALTDGARALIAADLAAWDEGSIGVISTMQNEVNALESERHAIMEEATKTVTEDDGNGGISVSRSMEFAGDMGERLQKIETQLGKARARVADSNTRAAEGLEAKLESDPLARTAIKRGFLRAANPSIYNMPRDLSTFFAKASAIEGMTAEGKVRVAALGSEWIEAREKLCEEFIASLEESKEKSESIAANDPAAGMRAMQAQARERKLLRESLEQAASSSFRRLKDLLIVEVGAEKAEELGELPVQKKRALPQIHIGG